MGAGKFAMIRWAVALVLLRPLFLPGQDLPGAYFPFLQTGIERVEARYPGGSRLRLREIEEQAGWRHFPHAILAAAVLYEKKSPANPRQGDRALLALALRIGDLLCDEDEGGRYYDRLDSYRDTYMWLEAYRLLEPRLDAARTARWRAALVRNVEQVVARTADWRDFPAYTALFLGTSMNHYSLWALNLLLAGRQFDREEWRSVGEHVLGRLARTEQTPDGYWGEYSRTGPTNGYGLLTLDAVGVYWETTRDPAAREAIRRATRFYLHFTYPDGQPVEVLNDRNRYWDLGLYGNFAFSQSAEGRRFAQFLFSRFPAERLDMEALGRIAQNALYYRDGPRAPMPLDRPEYSLRLSGPAGIRKTGPWLDCLSGLTASRPAAGQWFLDRQASLSVFHRKTGLILSGAQSKNQPELATFTEVLGGVAHTRPLSGHLEMSAARDRLWLSFNTFFARIEVPRAGEKELELLFAISGRGAPPEEARLSLQLRLVPGEELEWGAGGRTRLDGTVINRNFQGPLRHHGWTLEADREATLTWPVFPYNPYRNGPETALERAVGVISFPLRLPAERERFVRPDQQVLSLRLRVP